MAAPQVRQFFSQTFPGRFGENAMDPRDRTRRQLFRRPRLWPQDLNFIRRKPFTTHHPAMTNQEILKCMSDTGALLTGHFQLRSGLHSDHYFQAALLLQHTLIAEKLCAELAAPWRGGDIDVVISPAVGGLVVGQEVGRALGTRAIFAEKDDNSNLLLRRGFTLRRGERVLVAEDVVTKGGRVQQTIDLVRAYGADPVGVVVIADRSAGGVDFGIPFRSLVKLQLQTFAPEECPLCRQGVPFDHPGSK